MFTKNSTSTLTMTVFPNRTH